jgi:non-specific serine/threonine protein kinase
LRDFDRARQLLDESLSLARQLDSPRAIGMALRFLADLAYDRAEYAEAAATYEQSLTLARELGNTHEIAYALRGLGSIARARGDYARARELLRESLRLLASLGDRRCTPICLEGVACTEVGVDWAERAVRMLAAAQALQGTTGAPAPPTEMADYQRTEADARAHLGQERFAAAWAAGETMSLNEAVAFALAADEQAMTSSSTGPFRPSVGGSATLDSDGGRVERQQATPLSARERDVVALIASGLSNRQIAEQLVLSVRTVERHIENVYNRLGISGKAGRAIVTAYALRHHLVDAV